MEESERYEALSPAETAALRKKSQSGLKMLVLVAVPLIGVTAWGAWKSSWGGLLLIIVFGLLGAGLATWQQLRSVPALNRDVRDGKKKIVVARVESQRQDIRQTGQNSDVIDNALDSSGPTMSYSYLLKVRGKEFKVSENQYYKCKPGQLVEIHLAPHSEHVFSLKVLEAGKTASGPV
jgi:hypothetical protein